MSTVAMMLSISSVVRMSGSGRPNLGVSDLIVYQQEVEETADAAQAAGLRGLFAPTVVEPCHVALDHRSLDLAGSDVVLAEDEVRELAQVAHVRFHGVLRETFFEFDIGPVTTSRLFPLFRIFCHPLPAIFRDYR
jgi:hypothetical protein